MYLVEAKFGNESYPIIVDANSWRQYKDGSITVGIATFAAGAWEAIRLYHPDEGTNGYPYPVFAPNGKIPGDYTGLVALMDSK